MAAAVALLTEQIKSALEGHGHTCTQTVSKCLSVLATGSFDFEDPHVSEALSQLLKALTVEDSTLYEKIANDEDTDCHNNLLTVATRLLSQPLLQVETLRWLAVWPGEMLLTSNPEPWLLLLLPWLFSPVDKLREAAVKVMDAWHLDAWGRKSDLSVCPSVRERLCQDVTQLSTFVQNKVKDWSRIWCLVMNLLHSELKIPKNTTIINRLLAVEELAFKSNSQEVRRQAFNCWRHLMDVFIGGSVENVDKRVRLITQPMLCSKNSVMVDVKVDLLWHLIFVLSKVHPNLVNLGITPFLRFCFMPNDTGRRSLGPPPEMPDADMHIAYGNAMAQLLSSDPQNVLQCPHKITLERLPFPVLSNPTLVKEALPYLLPAVGEVTILLCERTPGLLKEVWSSLLRMLSIQPVEEQLRLLRVLQKIQVDAAEDPEVAAVLLSPVLEGIVCGPHALPPDVLSFPSRIVPGPAVGATPAQLLAEILLSAPMMDKASSTCYATMLGKVVVRGLEDPHFLQAVTRALCACRTSSLSSVWILVANCLSGSLFAGGAMDEEGVRAFLMVPVQQITSLSPSKFTQLQRVWTKLFHVAQEKADNVQVNEFCGYLSTKIKAAIKDTKLIHEQLMFIFDLIFAVEMSLKFSEDTNENMDGHQTSGSPQYLIHMVVLLKETATHVATSEQRSKTAARLAGCVAYLFSQALVLPSAAALLLSGLPWVVQQSLTNALIDSAVALWEAVVSCVESRLEALGARVVVADLAGPLETALSHSSFDIRERARRLWLDKLVPALENCGEEPCPKLMALASDPHTETQLSPDEPSASILSKNIVSPKRCKQKAPLTETPNSIFNLPSKKTSKKWVGNISQTPPQNNREESDSTAGTSKSSLQPKTLKTSEDGAGSLQQASARRSSRGSPEDQALTQSQNEPQDLQCSESESQKRSGRRSASKIKLAVPLLGRPLTKHQKEALKRRRDDIPALYSDLTQDSQETQFSEASQDDSQVTIPQRFNSPNGSATPSTPQTFSILQPRQPRKSLLASYEQKFSSTESMKTPSPKPKKLPLSASSLHMDENAVMDLPTIKLSPSAGDQMKDSTQTSIRTSESGVNCVTVCNKDNSKRENKSAQHTQSVNGKPRKMLTGASLSELIQIAGENLLPKLEQKKVTNENTVTRYFQPLNISGLNPSANIDTTGSKQQPSTPTEVDPTNESGNSKLSERAGDRSKRKHNRELAKHTDSQPQRVSRRTQRAGSSSKQKLSLVNSTPTSLERKKQSPIKMLLERGKRVQTIASLQNQSPVSSKVASPEKQSVCVNQVKSAAPGVEADLADSGNCSNVVDSSPLSISQSPTHLALADSGRRKKNQKPVKVQPVVANHKNEFIPNVPVSGESVDGRDNVLAAHTGSAEGDKVRKQAVLCASPTMPCDTEDVSASTSSTEKHMVHVSEKPQSVNDPHSLGKCDIVKDGPTCQQGSPTRGGLQVNKLLNEKTQSKQRQRKIRNSLIKPSSFKVLPPKTRSGQGRRSQLFCSPTSEDQYTIEAYNSPDFMAQEDPVPPIDDCFTQEQVLEKEGTSKQSEDSTKPILPNKSVTSPRNRLSLNKVTSPSQRPRVRLRKGYKKISIPIPISRNIMDIKSKEKADEVKSSSQLDSPIPNTSSLLATDEEQSKQQLQCTDSDQPIAVNVDPEKATHVQECSLPTTTKVSGTKWNLDKKASVVVEKISISPGAVVSVSERGTTVKLVKGPFHGSPFKLENPERILGVEVATAVRKRILEDTEQEKPPCKRPRGRPRKKVLADGERTSCLPSDCLGSRPTVLHHGSRASHIMGLVAQSPGTTQLFEIEEPESLIHGDRVESFVSGVVDTSLWVRRQPLSDDKMPTSSSLKRKQNAPDGSPARKTKRVSFMEPPVTKKLTFQQDKEPHLPEEEEVVINLLSEEEVPFVNDEERGGALEKTVIWGEWSLETHVPVPETVAPGSPPNSPAASLLKTTPPESPAKPIIDCVLLSSTPNLAASCSQSGSQTAALCPSEQVSGLCLSKVDSPLSQPEATPVLSSLQSLTLSVIPFSPTTSTLSLSPSKLTPSSLTSEISSSTTTVTSLPSPAEADPPLCPAETISPTPTTPSPPHITKATPPPASVTLSQSPTKETLPTSPVKTTSPPSPTKPTPSLSPVKATAPSSPVKPTPPPSTVKATPPTSSAKATPPTSSAKATPPTGLVKATPPTGPAKATSPTSPAKAALQPSPVKPTPPPPPSTVKATPSTSSAKATPPTKSSKETLPTSSAKAIPQTSPVKSTPPPVTLKATPPTRSSKETPPTSPAKATPPSPAKATPPTNPAKATPPTSPAKAISPLSPSGSDSANSQLTPTASQGSLHEVAAPLLDSQGHVYPSLVGCPHLVNVVTDELVSANWSGNLREFLNKRSIYTVSDLCSLSEVEINRLPIRTPKVKVLQSVMKKYEMRMRQSALKMVCEYVGQNEPPRATRVATSEKRPLPLNVLASEVQERLQTSPAPAQVLSSLLPPSSPQVDAALRDVLEARLGVDGLIRSVPLTTLMDTVVDRLSLSELIALLGTKIQSTSTNATTDTLGQLFTVMEDLVRLLKELNVRRNRCDSA